MIRVSTSVDFLNSVANHEAVRPWLGGEGPIDLGPLMAAGSVLLEDDDGGFLYTPLALDTYEVHSMFLPGANAVEAARQGLDYMFSATPCVEVVTKVPAPNKGALGLVRACHFDKRYVRRGGWIDGRDFTVYGLAFDKWAQTSAACLDAGRSFHALIEGALGHENHPEDEAHDRAAGAAALLFKAGQPTKAAWTYNKWAMVAGYHMIYQAEAGLMDIGNALIGLNERGDLEVVECR